jgi:hypothetical protein
MQLITIDLLLDAEIEVGASVRWLVNPSSRFAPRFPAGPFTAIHVLCHGMHFPACR